MKPQEQSRLSEREEQELYKLRADWIKDTNDEPEARYLELIELLGQAKGATKLQIDENGNKTQIVIAFSNRKEEAEKAEELARELECFLYLTHRLGYLVRKGRGA